MLGQPIEACAGFTVHKANMTAFVRVFKRYFCTHLIRACKALRWHKWVIQTV